ncbi:MAG: GAF domain-containing protein [Cyclonatronaceae bacterium]
MTNIAQTDREERLQALPEAVQNIVSGAGGRDSKLLAIAQHLHDQIDVYDWVGFYLVDPDAHRELILGPYVGAPTDHTRIGFGTGICGQAADTLETFVIDDVTKESNYLSCSINVKSEIVVPIMKGNVLIGELDIDSNTVAAMDATDKRVLEEVCAIISRLY